MPGPNEKSPRVTEDLARIDREFLRELIKQVVSESLDARDTKLLKHIDDQFEEITAKVLSGFPDSDPIGHKLYHQEQIEYMKDRRALWKDIRGKSVSGVVWLILVLMGTAFWNHFKLLVNSATGSGPTP